jgi:hypothetical protein
LAPRVLPPRRQTWNAIRSPAPPFYHVSSATTTRCELHAHHLHLGRRGERRRYGALLIEALKHRLAQRGRTATFVGMGGPAMAAAGLERVVRAEDMAVWASPVVRHLPVSIASSAS